MSGLGRSLCAGFVALALTVALPVTGFAAPAEAPGVDQRRSGEERSGASDDPRGDEAASAAIRSALEAGDLSSARELAVAQSEAEPSADNFALEAEVWLALGDYEQAKLALDEAIAALPEDASEARAELEQLRDEVEASSRGTRTDEPESTHREQLDHDRAERLAALTPKPAPPPELVDEPKPPEPIVKKWYFWVTLGAIVATAGAIVGVAVSSSVAERDSDAASRQPAPAGGLIIRF